MLPLLPEKLGSTATPSSPISDAVQTGMLTSVVTLPPLTSLSAPSFSVTVLPPSVLELKKMSLLPRRLSCQATNSRLPAAARLGCHWFEGVSRLGSNPARESSSWRAGEKLAPRLVLRV